MKLNIGCFKTRIDGFTGIDIFKDDTNKQYVDILVDTYKRLPIETESVEEIYCSHVLEHYHSVETVNVLSEWRRVLITGRKLYLAVPDIEATKECWDRHGWNDMVRDIFYGGHENAFLTHKNGFDYNSLSKDLYRAGFGEVKRIDIMPYNLEDCSDKYFKDTMGDYIQVSLNVEATK